MIMRVLKSALKREEAGLGLPWPALKEEGAVSQERRRHDRLEWAREGTVPSGSGRQPRRHLDPGLRRPLPSRTVAGHMCAADVIVTFMTRS